MVIYFHQSYAFEIRPFAGSCQPDFDKNKVFFAGNIRRRAADLDVFAALKMSPKTCWQFAKNLLILSVIFIYGKGG
jgi:hypothetical protein